MELINRIVEKLKSIAKDIVVFEFFRPFINDVEDLACLDCINELIYSLNNTVEWLQNPTNELINKAENDLITLDDLINEFKTIVLPKFGMEALTLVSSFSTTQIKKMTYYILNSGITNYEGQLSFEIFKTITYFPSTEYQNQVRNYLSKENLSFNDYELIMTSIKRNKKELKNEGLEIAYLELMAIYIGYLCTKE